VTDRGAGPAGPRLDGTVAIVTGGGRGIGRGVVERLARQGARVLVADLDAGAAEDAAAEAGRLGPVAVAHRVDMGDAEQAAGLAGVALDRFGRLDLLVNNAAWRYTPRAVGDVDEEYWRAMFAVNVGGTLRACQAAAPAMARSGGGSIVNVSSVMFLLGTATKVVYQTSKGAINDLTRALARDFARHRVRVNAVAPGVIETQRTVPDAHTPAFRAAYLDSGRIPVGRIGQPADIASVVLFLASRAGAGVNGQVVAVDGGLSLTL
jgi:NAD(P)-dependent dehydrogenase (short-subunit alcohol dehydrogenase family)